MFGKSLYEQDERISKVETICIDGVRARTSAIYENDKQIRHKVNPKTKTIDHA